MNLRYLAPLLLLPLAACGASGPSAAPVTVTATPTGPSVFTATGHIDVDGSTYKLYGSVPTCQVEEGYDDIATGAQVTVKSPQGDVVALGRLGVPLKHGPYACRFPFTVTDIPEGFPLYSVEVSHRGALTYSEDEMQSGLKFTLGS